VTLSNQLALPIHYTLDGSAPTVASPFYRDALEVAVPSILRASTFLGDRLVDDMPARELTQAALLRRSSDALKPCSGKLPLRLEDDAPANGPRRFFTVDLFDPCWIFVQAPLDEVTAIEVGVDQLPYNFQLGKDLANVVPRPASQSADGELLVKVGACSGATIATLPLLPASRNSGASLLRAPLPATTGKHDLCFVFTGGSRDLLWAIDAVQLIR
jgi:hexosaminidase